MERGGGGRRALLGRKCDKRATFITQATSLQTHLSRILFAPISHYVNCYNINKPVANVTSITLGHYTCDG